MRSEELEFHLRTAHRVAGSHRCSAGNAGRPPSQRDIDSTACTSWRLAAGQKRHTEGYRLPLAERSAWMPYRDRPPELPANPDPAGRMKDRANFACVASRRGASAPNPPARRYRRFEECIETV